MRSLHILATLTAAVGLITVSACVTRATAQSTPLQSDYIAIGVASPNPSSNTTHAWYINRQTGNVVICASTYNGGDPTPPICKAKPTP